MPDEGRTRERPGDGGALDRALRLFGDVRRGEGATVLLMSANVFLLLLGYYILKTVREPLILLGGGAALRSYAAAAQTLGLLVWVPLYSGVAARLPRRWTLAAVFLFFVACLELFSLGLAMRAPFLGFAFFVWVGVFNLTAIAQFWSYANEIYSRSEGDRLFPLIAVGATAGAPLGAAIAQRLFATGVSPQVMLQVAAAILIVHLGLYSVTSARVPRRTAAMARPLVAGNGFALVVRNRYLVLLAALLVVLSLVKAVGGYLLAHAVLAAADARAAAHPGYSREDFIGSFYGGFYLWVDVATVAVQALLVSRLARRFGMAGVLLFLPLVAFGGYGLAAAGVVAVGWAKFADNTSDYSVMNTAKQMVWLPTTPEEKYMAKQAVDGFFVRAGDLVAALLVFLGDAWLHLSVAGFSRLNVVFSAASIVAAVLVLREYARLTRPAGAAAAPVGG
jgi:AAA family ATP:ADP antiporter